MKIRTKLTIFFAAIFFVLILSVSIWYQYRIFYILRQESIKNIEMFSKGFLDFNRKPYRIIDSLEQLKEKLEYRMNRDHFSKIISRRTWNALYDENFNLLTSTPLAKEFPVKNIKSYVHQRYFILKFRADSDYFKNEDKNIFSDYKINMENEFYTDKDNYVFYCIGKISEINIGSEKAYFAVLFPENKKIQYIRQTFINVIFTLLFSIIIIIVVGLFYSKYSLNPINKIIHELNNISQKNLSKRIKLGHNNKDEIAEISVSINNLLERIENAFNMEKQFISDVSHEFKTPIAILQLNMNNISNNPHLTDDEIDKITSSLEILYSLDLLIKKLLYLSRLESNSCQFNPDFFYLNDLLSSIKNNLQSIAEIKNINLALSIPDEHIKINGDKELLYIALYNITENALKYTDKGYVLINTEEDNDKVIISIEDSGIGIPQDKIDKIFDKLYRVDSSRHDDKSFGIGLSITKRIIDLHGAKIKIESIENIKTKFIIILHK